MKLLRSGFTDMCNICVQVPLCQRDGCSFDLGPSAPYPGLGGLSSLGLAVTYKGSSSNLPAAGSAVEVSPALPGRCVTVVV